MKNNILEINGSKIGITTIDDKDFICITDIAKTKESKSKTDDIIRNWIRSRYTIEFLGTWESLYNKNFKYVEFDGFRKEAGLHTFTLSVSEWVKKTNAIGIFSKKGKYGGTYAHKDIALEFASSISPVFKIYLIKEFERLKQIENNNKEWSIKRLISKSNYLIHTDAIKNYILPQKNYYKNTEWLKYTEEADMLNVIIFNTTAKEWRTLNPKLASKYNIRDFATLNELTILSNLETHNAELIKENKSIEERFKILSEIANYQLNILNESDKLKLNITNK